MVDHLTRITVDAGLERAGALADALAAIGFAVRRERRRIVAESSAVEAQAAKRHLRALGFRDRDYRVFLEYVRRWGVL
jgi:hypothetical protein